MFQKFPNFTVYLTFLFLIYFTQIDQIESKPYTSFKGQRTSWYFNTVDGRVVIGLNGPFSKEGLCQQLAKQKPKREVSGCYQRETIEFLAWRQNQIQTWVLPIQTGKLSRHLVFSNFENCHRVAVSDHYFSNTGFKILKKADLKICLPAFVYFDEFENQYRFVKRHDRTSIPYPPKYKAWSISLEKGHYRRLLQFRFKQQCELVAKEGKYYSFIPRSLFSKMKVAHTIPSELKKCIRRAPFANEIPLIYDHINEHQKSSAATAPEAIDHQKEEAWVLSIKKDGGVFPLYFEKRKDCFRVQQNRFYFYEINRGGIISSVILKSSFKKTRQNCTKMKLPSIVKDRLYPFMSKHYPK